ncbi:MAG: 4a-hydroxytetrahydrobiopterin dehydratase [Pseudomonadota bacterium]
MTAAFPPIGKLTEIADDLATAGWAPAEDGLSISKTYKFAGFPEAMAFMTRNAFHAEAQDHHPEWFNVYNRVEVKLTTHDAGGVTEKDITLARAMEASLSS